MTDLLLKKYNVPVPRYTSYPPANYFSTDFKATDLVTAMAEANEVENNKISFYIHIPFCKHLCHYCGCNSWPMAKKEQVERYINALHQEIDKVCEQIDPKREIAQIHYGGGSPSSIPLHFLQELNEQLLSKFKTIEKPEIAIECHPGYLKEEDWHMLLAAGFNRFSLGIQDFNEEVLHVVNRRPSLLPVAEIVAILRAAGATINMDFIYGLPLQTMESFTTTIEKAIALRPDRLVTFSYAHVPWVNKRQLILERAGLPDNTTKQALFDKAASLLQEAGYQPIGMDHFVLPTDELNLALQAGELHRNFQGYCTRRTTGQVYAFGASAIYQLDTAYAQNEKDLATYIEMVEKGELPTARGYSLSYTEQITREVIETWMCNEAIHWKELAERMNRSVKEIQVAVLVNIPQLQELVADELILWDEQGIEMTPKGKPFIRNVAAALDALMLHNTQRYSKPL
ncbi:MAG: oxygen-independent coproporphyrinogen III oxidase [Bacteroidaceae bacterium]|nr:oxygen-independent coproporphyrinogen III oxidase [Bacteroidaceae bacterium]